MLLRQVLTSELLGVQQTIYAGPHLDCPDTRANYGEDRYITFGALDGRMVVMVWTPRGNARRVISMRKANDREIKKHAHRLG